MFAQTRKRGNIDKKNYFIYTETAVLFIITKGLGLLYLIMDNASFKIENIIIEGFFGLAPMAGVGDRAFRSICRSFGASYTVSEMVSAKALCYNDKKTRELLCGDDPPAAVQIFGSDPDFMADAAQIALELSGAQILDINMGCPAKKIVSPGDGAALMKNPALAGKIIRSVKNAVSCPVTVKIRAGWSRDCKNAVEFAIMAEASGCDALCIHGRTADQGYSAGVDVSIMAEVVSVLKIPVMVNGGITDAKSGVELLCDTGARFALIGRGALGNPWIFRECNAAVRGESIPERPALAERLRTFILQTEFAAAHKGEKIACKQARTHFCYYLKGVKNAAKYRGEATCVTTIAQIKKLAEEILADAAENV